MVDCIEGVDRPLIGQRRVIGLSLLNIIPILGTLAITTANTYSGGTTVSGGVLQLGSTAALGSGPLAVAAAGTLDLNGNDNAVPSFSGAGTVINTGGVDAKLAVERERGRGQDESSS